VAAYPLVALELRRRTAIAHERVESGLALLDPPAGTGRLAAIVQRFEAFWRVNENVLDAAVPDELSRAVQWSRRLRASTQAADLVALGAVPLAVGPAPVFASPSAADVLGWLYVGEGSCLGGAVIARRWPDHPVGGLRTFRPYPDGPGPMWRSYLDVLGSWVGDDAGRRAAVVASGVTVFEALAEWLEPVFVEAVA